MPTGLLLPNFMTMSRIRQSRTIRTWHIALGTFLVALPVVIIILIQNAKPVELFNPLIEDRILYPSPTATPTKYPSKAYRGKASYYTNDYCVQYNPTCQTANGEIFDDTKLTIACRKEIKLGTYVKITYKDKSVVAKCNDRGSFPEKYGRVADLSKATFEALAPLSKGVLLVELEVIK